MISVMVTHVFFTVCSITDHVLATVCSILDHVLAAAECTSSFEEMQDCADLCTHSSNVTAREAAYKHKNFCK